MQEKKPKNGTYDIIRIDDSSVVAVDKVNKPKRGEKFIIMYEDESFMEIVESPVDDFDDYADSDFTDMCYTIVAASPKIEGIPLLPISQAEIEASLSNGKVSVEGFAKWLDDRMNEAPSTLWDDMNTLGKNNPCQLMLKEYTRITKFKLPKKVVLNFDYSSVVILNSK